MSTTTFPTIMDTGAVTPLFSKAVVVEIGINVTTLTLGRPSLNTEGTLKKYMGVIEEVNFMLSRGTSQERWRSLKATMVDTTAECALLGMHFVAHIAGDIDTWLETF